MKYRVVGLEGHPFNGKTATPEQVAPSFGPRLELMRRVYIEDLERLGHLVAVPPLLERVKAAVRKIAGRA